MMIGLGKSRANKLILFGLVLLCVCFLLASVEAYKSYKAHKRFAKHLYKFLKKEKYFLKKKGLEAAAILALTSMGKKKIPIPLPLPIPIVHQPIIQEPMFLPPIGKFTEKGIQKGMALDMLKGTHGGVGGLGALGGLGMGGLGMGLGGLGGLGLGGGFI